MPPKLQLLVYIFTTGPTIIFIETPVYQNSSNFLLVPRWLIPYKYLCLCLISKNKQQTKYWIYNVFSLKIEYWQEDACVERKKHTKIQWYNGKLQIRKNSKSIIFYSCLFYKIPFRTQYRLIDNLDQIVYPLIPFSGRVVFYTTQLHFFIELYIIWTQRDARNEVLSSLYLRYLSHRYQRRLIYLKGLCEDILLSWAQYCNEAIPCCHTRLL